ncbi:hypothetical protein MPC1_990006 [Methylocella tundrae]|nr:hypothetical protein MPC1_990006 [Methylocella tundrae]
MVGTMGGLDLPVPVVLPANRLCGSDHSRPGILPPRPARLGLRGPPLRPRRLLRLRNGVHIQIRQRRLSDQYGRRVRDCRPGGWSRRVPVTYPLRHHPRPDRDLLELLHAALRHRLGVAHLVLFHRSSPHARHRRRQRGGSLRGEDDERPNRSAAPRCGRIAIDGVIIARALHVLAVVIWIGEVMMATTVVLRAVRRGDLGADPLKALQTIEHRFV